MQKSDGVVVVRGGGAWCRCGGGCASTTEGAAGGLILVRSPTPCQVPCTSVPVSVPRGPCSPCVPKGTVAWTLPPAPLPPSTPQAKSHPARGTGTGSTAPGLARYPTHPPVPCPCHTTTHQSRPPSPKPMQCVSTTPQRREGGGQRDRASTRPGLRDARRGYIESSRLPPPEPHPACRASLFLSSISIPAPVAESCSVRAGHPPPEPSSQVSRSQPNAHTHADLTHRGTSDGPRQQELEE